MPAFARWQWCPRCPCLSESLAEITLLLPKSRRSPGIQMEVIIYRRKPTKQKTINWKQSGDYMGPVNGGSIYDDSSHYYFVFPYPADFHSRYNLDRDKGIACFWTRTKDKGRTSLAERMIVA